jgi:hypothetical protein
MLVVELFVLIVAVAWITNLYNFMDGSDGLAGGMATIGFGAYGVAAWIGQDAALAALCLALSAAAFAFLVHNHHPARMFLGDVGSIPLGFLAAALGIVGWRNDVWPLWFPVLVFGPFIGDATITLVRRLLRRERVWQAHREHYYQRMVRMGFGHRGTAWTGYTVMLLCAGAALVGRAQAPAVQATVFLATSAVLGGLATWWRPASPGWPPFGCALTSTSPTTISGSCWARCRGCSASTPPCSGRSGSTGVFGAMPAFRICSASP